MINLVDFPSLDWLRSDFTTDPEIDPSNIDRSITYTFVELDEHHEH